MIRYITEEDRGEPDRIDALFVRVGVNMGDHAETVWRSVEVDPDETVRSLMDRLIEPTNKYKARDYEDYVRLQFVEPVVIERGVSS